MTENGLFVLSKPETQLHDILWAIHDGKNHGRSEREENIGVFPVTVGARRWALTEPERGVRLLNLSDCTAAYALLN